MALSERSRSALYQGLSTLVDEEALQEMLSYFPARDVEEPVTKEFLRAELAHLENRLINQFRTELNTELAGLRTEFKAEIRRSVLMNGGMLIALAALLLTAMRA